MNLSFSKFCIALSIFFISLTSHLLAFNFSDVHRSFQQDITKIYGGYKSSRIAIVYNNKFRNELKYKINLVQFKKELSHELNKSFRIVDPLIVNEILSTNQIDYQQMITDNFILKSFSDRADSTQVLMVDLKPHGSNIQADFKLYTPQNDVISQVIMDLPVDNKVSQSTQATPVIESNKPSVIDEIASNYEASVFNDNHNESWLFFSPTAYINKKKNYLDLLLWVDDLAEVDIELTRMRYDFSALGKLQLGIDFNTIQKKKNARIEEPNTKNSKGLHSSYANVRYQVIGEDDLPVSILIGIKRRLYWNKDNTDFLSEDKTTDDKNDKYNEATIFTSVSGKSKSIGLMYNVYLDNQTFGLGAKYLITSNIKFYIDSIHYYYEKAQIKNDVAVGLQAYNSDGAVTTLSYQQETEQVQFGVSFSW